VNGAFYVGSVGLETQQRALDVLANNIANMNTPAFKRSQVRFREVVARRKDVVRSADLTPPAQTLSGVRLDRAVLVDQQGALRKTGAATDLAIDGAGFIELMGPAGQTYLWRGGGLKVNEDGLLAAANGMPLKAAVTVPRDAGALTIGADGAIRANLPDVAESVELGQIVLVRVDDAEAMERVDGGLYRLRDDARIEAAPAGEDGNGTLVQGSLEQSNVALNEEMVALMLVQRAYAANAQVMQAADALMGIANGLRR
jgi:flagellar basal-body rod protein FlgG